MYLCLCLSVWLYSYRLNWWVTEVYINFNIGHTLRPVHHTITCLACFIKSLNKSISLINLSRLSMKLSVVCLMVGGVLQSVGAGQPHDHLCHVIIPLTISYYLMTEVVLLSQSQRAAPRCRARGRCPPWTLSLSHCHSERRRWFISSFGTHIYSP